MKKLSLLVFSTIFLFTCSLQAALSEDIQSLRNLTDSYNKATVVITNYVQANSERNTAMRHLRVRIRQVTPALLNEAVATIENTPVVIPGLQQQKKKYGNNREFNRVYRPLSQAFGNFLSAEQKFVNDALSNIKNATRDLRKTLELAQSKKNGQYFIDAIDRDLTRAENTLKLFEAISGPNEPQVQEAKALVKEAKEYAENVKKDLEEEILRVSRAPKDKYHKRDRKQLIAKIEKAWKANNPQDNILEIRIPYKDWRREVGITWNNGYHRWEKYDRKYLQFAVIVKTNDKVATIYPAFINVDNITNEERIVASHKSTYEIRKVLLSNL